MLFSQHWCPRACVSRDKRAGNTSLTSFDFERSTLGTYLPKYLAV